MSFAELKREIAQSFGERLTKVFALPPGVEIAFLSGKESLFGNEAAPGPWVVAMFERAILGPRERAAVAHGIGGRRGRKVRRARQRRG